MFLVSTLLKAAFIFIKVIILHYIKYESDLVKRRLKRPAQAKNATHESITISFIKLN